MPIQRSMTRRTLLAGSSMMALVLSGSHGALARPIGSYSASVSAPMIASDAATASAQQAAAAAKKTQDTLTRALQSIQAMQAAARNAAQAAGSSRTLPQLVVPNGLTPGGLQVAPSGTWSGANAPTQSTSGGQTNVNIQQTAQQAILSWTTFNVGAQTAVNFNQQASTWTVLNRVVGNLGPSQILGSVNAPGQVLVINQNGIIFGGASQINVGSLIASTADITDRQFSSSGIYSTQGSNGYLPSFTGAGGKIIVEPGAQITTAAPGSATSGGGFVLMMGTEVDNAGSITTPMGQAQFAAGDDFILRQGYGTTNNNRYSTTLGNEIAPVIHAGSGSGSVDNTGLVFAQQGDITLAGHTVVQDGILLSTTSVNQRGTIHLLNSASDATGSVTLTGDSLTAVLPETADAAALLSGINSGATALNSQRDGLIAASGVNALATGQFDNLSTLADRKDLSRIEIVTGGLVDFQNGSQTMAQGGQISVSAGQRVFAESGATLDVSGSQDVMLPMSINNIPVNIQGNELRDSPENRDGGTLPNATVWVDARDLVLVPAGTGGDSADRYYTSGGLLEVSGYLNNIDHTIGEWTAVGGVITLSAPQVVAQAGSTFNISGGSVQYQAGYLQATRLIGSDGRIYNVNTAPAGLTYIGVDNGFTVLHYVDGKLDSNVTEVFRSPFGNMFWQDSYTVGRDAGSLILSTPTSLFEGTIVADVIAGQQQTNARPSGATDGYKLTQNTVPLAGTLALGQYNGSGLANAYTTDVKFDDVAPVTAGLDPTAALPADRTNTAWFDAPTLDSFGLGGLNIATGNKIAVNAPLNFAPGAQVKLVAPTVDIAADITARSGSVTVSNILTGSAGSTALTTTSGGAQLTLEAGVTLDMRGLWVNALADPDNTSGLGFLNGGNVTFDSTQNVTLAAGSTIDVSSGGGILVNGKTQGGKGGNVTLVAGHPFGNLNAPSTLTSDGNIRAYGVNGGGTLTISSPGNILIGDNAVLSGGFLAAGTPAPIALVLAQDLTIPAGQPLPLSQTNTFTSLGLGEIAPVDIAPVVVPKNLTTAANWPVPAGMGGVWVGNTLYGEGQIVPAGSLISSFLSGSIIKAGTSIDASVFPNGLPVQPYTVVYTLGSIQTTPTIYRPGTAIPAGVTLAQTVLVTPAPALKPSFFSAGFASYDINGVGGVLVADGTSVAPTMPVYQFTSNSFAVPSGSDPAMAMTLWLPPTFIENPLRATLTQRGGASLTLRSLTTVNNVATGGAIVVGDGASITVDPGKSIKLDAFGQITVDGSLTAHGGSISLINEADGSTDAARNFDQAGNGRGISIWIGGNSRLDVSGEAVSALDQLGRAYGLVTNGGAIDLGGSQVVNVSTHLAASTTAFVIIRPGAELDADGAQITIDPAAGMRADTSGSNVTVASSGGSIALDTFSGIYNDGNLHAFSGGAGAVGGSLAIALNTPVYPNVPVVPNSDLVSSVMTIAQALPASALPQDIAPGTDAASLAFGRATVSADAVKTGGFGSLSLTSGNFMLFSGDVSLALGQSLTLTAGNIISGVLLTAPPSSTSTLTSSVSLAAPYVLLRSPPVPNTDNAVTGPNVPPNIAVPAGTTFAVNADQIDVQGSVAFATAYKTVSLTSQGDIRFLAPAANMGAFTSLQTWWDLDLTAAQVYPATGAVAYVSAGTLAIGRINAVDPALPLSVFGSLIIQAGTIEQGGIVRAPLGLIVLGDNGGGLTSTGYTRTIDLLPGSITSVSAAGLTIPYGGTVDGVTYSYNGTAITPRTFSTDIFGRLGTGVVLDAQSVNVRSGATLDLSGGGTVAGAGFVSGRGGSVNVLNTPLVNANPTTPLSASGDQVYAIVPGYGSAYAPVAAENGAGDPVVGQQITIPVGVPGLPAGTYTLLPSNYALLPGAYRVELGKTSTAPISGAAPIGNGTYVTSAYTGIGNTAIKSALPSVVLITPGTAVRHYSQYNEENYSSFLIANAALFGGIRPPLPADGKILELIFDRSSSAATAPALTFDGTALLQAASGGVPGGVYAVGSSNLEIYATAPTAGFNGVSISERDLDAIGAPRLTLGGFDYLSQPGALVTFTAVDNALYIRDNVTLKAGELFLVGGSGGVTVGSGATLTTIGQGAPAFDSSDGYSYGTNGAVVLALSNGDLEFTAANSPGTITVGAGSRLYSEGTLAFVTKSLSNIDPSAHFGSRDITLAVGTIDIGDSAVIAAAGAPAGFLFNQSLFNVLVNGDPSHGAPALQQLTLSAGSSINVFGSTSLDATGTGVDLVLNTPAIYGYGTSSDHATISAGKIAWNGIVGATPPAIAAGGPGTGAGTLDLVAGEIDFGKFVSLDTTTSSRVIYGFSNVNLIATSQIVSAGNSALYVYQAPSTVAGDVFGQSGTGGNLTLATPLLTGVQKSIMAYTAGGALSVASPSGYTPSAATSTVSGAEIDLTGDSVAIASTVLLPSGKLVVNATNDITLDAGSRIDLSGQPSMIQSATVYGFGGIAIFNSVQGGVTQAAGSVIDVSATNSDAGSITISAGSGLVALGGALNGSATAGYTSGDFSVTAGTLADFAGLNAILTQGGIFDARSFDIKTGDLTIGDGVKAHNVTVSVDGGSLTVTGTIDASGDAPGTIRLSGGNGLTLASTAVLDAHGNMLQVDSYKDPVTGKYAPIEAKNRGHIELTAAGGALNLFPGATMNLSTPDGVAYGDVVLNAQRTGETSGDIAVNATGRLNISGAYSIALNAFWTYNLAGGSVITQSTLDGYDVASTAFINVAIGNGALQTRVAGLSAYGNAYHLRPGVQITSSGDLTISGNVDLSSYRYGPNADRDVNSAGYGAGEPMSLVIRAGGNLTIAGSISDGFRSAPGIPAVFGTIDITNSSLFTDEANPYGPDGTGYIASSNVTLMTAWTMPNDLFYQEFGGFLDANGNVYNVGDTIPAGTVLEAWWGIGFENGVPWPTVGHLVSPAIPPASAVSAAAAMLAAGSQSASLRLVAGADLAAADMRILQTTEALKGSGNLTLNDPLYASAQSPTFFSVVRTGTGSLELLAGGNFSEATPFGVYTAGTQTAPILVNGSNPYDLLGTASAGANHAWYPEHGGDLLLVAQQDVTGHIAIADNSTRWVDSDITSNWLWRQGGGGMAADPAAWWINFGVFAETNNNSQAPDSSLIGFQGIGTLGGGNLTVIAGRNAGITGSGSTGLDLAVASTGRVLPDGTLVQTGGGDLTVRIGGALNPVLSGSAPDYFGSITDLRGNITVNAGSIGVLGQNQSGAAFTSLDPRTLDPDTFKRSTKIPGPVVTPGDGTVSITTRGDLVFGGASDAGMESPVDKSGIPYNLINADGTITFVASGAISSFTLWTPTTAISLYAAGGDVAPLTTGTYNNSNQNGNGFYPGTLIVAAANGDIRFAEPPNIQTTNPVLELAPSPSGQLELLAAGSIYGSTQVVAMSGAAMSSLATPFQPVFSTNVNGGGTTNASPNSAYVGGWVQNDPIAFGPDTASNLHAGDAKPALVYAGVDIDDLTLGEMLTPGANIGTGFLPNPATWYIAAKPFEIIAGRDVVGTGLTPDVFFNRNGNDITLIRAGRDIIYQSVTIAGQGLLDVEAGRNLYQGYYGSLVSKGDVLNNGDTSNGAGITVLTGVGANGPDYADFAKLYFDPANQLPGDGTPLAGSGKVVHTYDAELLTWLQQRFGYAGTSAGALSYFLALPSEQQGVFVRDIYYKELTLGGREYNDQTSSRYRSYLRGREAIATLFPSQNANGQPITYSGGLTMFSGVTKNGLGTPFTADAGIHTQFGGAIQILDPGGQTILGTEGVVPGANAGVLTQGQNSDIDIYSYGSILLGESRIMTTFGGNILAWSATGDINAGRGSKTTTIFTPPLLGYDHYGNVSLSPAAPSSGAGIAALATIPGTARSNVDLIAPLGTIDAGEAGIRVSGNLNLAALQIVNAANIQVQGTATGLPTVAAPTGALSLSANTTAATQQAAAPTQPNNNGQPSVIIVEFLGFGGGEGDSPAPQDDRKPKDRKQSFNNPGRAPDYNNNSAVQIAGYGVLTDAEAKILTPEEKRKLGQR